MSRLTCHELLARGDAARRARDVAGLSHVAQLLARRMGDPLEMRCLELVHACRCDRSQALRAWPALRKAVADRVAIAGT